MEGISVQEHIHTLHENRLRYVFITKRSSSLPGNKSAFFLFRCYAKVIEVDTDHTYDKGRVFWEI